MATSMALASALVLPVVSKAVIPYLPDKGFVLFDQLSDLFQLIAAKPIGFRQHHRVEPELRIILGFLNVNVDRFLCFTAEKEESVSLASENSGRGHGKG